MTLDVDVITAWPWGEGSLSTAEMQEFGDEIVGNVLELFEDEVSDNSWHGACLCLAELARRGALPRSRFQELGPRIAKALQIDIRRGPHRSSPQLHQ